MKKHQRVAVRAHAIPSVHVCPCQGATATWCVLVILFVPPIFAHAIPIPVARRIPVLVSRFVAVSVIVLPVLPVQRGAIGTRTEIVRGGSSSYEEANVCFVRRNIMMQGMKAPNTE